MSGPDDSAAQVLSALRQTQLDHHAEHRADVVEIRAGLAQIGNLLDALARGTAGAKTRQRVNSPTAAFRSP
jgi:hypothetical protein